MISEKHKALLQLISEYESVFKEYQLTQKKLADLNHLTATLSKEKEALLQENALLKEKEAPLVEKVKELEKEKERNRKLQIELEKSQKNEKSSPSAQESSTLELDLVESRTLLSEKEEELAQARRQYANECKRREIDRDDLMRTLAETANQLQRQLTLIRELKEEILRLQSELTRSMSEKEAHIEEIARLKAKVHELTLFLERKESSTLAPQELEKAASLRSHLEDALTLLSRQREER